MRPLALSAPVAALLAAPLAPALAVAAVLALLAPGAVAGQDPEIPQGPAVDTAVDAAADTLDSVSARVRARLERLARTPREVDTLPAGAADTAAGAGGAGGAPNVRYQQQAPQDAAADTVMQALLGLPGYTVTRYEGVRALYSAEDGRLILIGTEEELARVRREGIELTADSAIVYDEAAGRIRSIGNAVFHPREGEPVTSQVLVYDLEQERGTAIGARTRYQETAEWIVTGDLTSVTEEVVHGRDAHFTSCDLEVPHYHFRTDELKVVADRILVARPVTLYFHDVPVGWLPFMAQSLERGRSSGLLTPRFSLNDVVRVNSSTRRRISNLGFYWAMSDYMDSWVAADWFSDEFVSLTGSLRFHWLRQFLRGQATYRQYWRSEGGQELAFNTNASWEATERTDVRISARYASSTQFVRRNSFDPREVTQSINSQGGVNHSFDWGTVSLNANRREFLSDDRVEMTMPSLNLSLRPMTFFEAPPSSARWYNNLTWSGSGNVRRNVTDRAPQADTFLLGRADRTDLRAAVSSSFNLGFLSWNQSVQYEEGVLGEVPSTFFQPTPFPRALPVPVEAEGADLGQARIDWSTGFSFQQPLIGTTSITPTVSLGGELLRSDTIPDATDWVSGPTRVDFGATLRSDIYGFYGGVGPFTAFRHKVSPSFTYSYSPAVTQTPLQERVFGGTTRRTRNTLSISLNQTIEAKMEEEEVEEVEAAAEAAEADEDREMPGPTPVPDEPVDGDDPLPPAAEAAGEAARAAAEAEEEESAADAGAADDPAVGEGAAGPPGSLQERSGGRPLTLLGLRTSVISYDFERADTAGFLQGFTSTVLRNQVSSDFLRGLTLSFEHDIFADSTTDRGRLLRSFDPHLSQVNLSFSLGSSSAIFRALDFLYDTDEGRAAVPPGEDPTERDQGMDEAQMIPGDRMLDPGQEYAPASPAGRGWNMRISYSLQRPRDEARRGSASQMLQTSLTMSPTEHWDLSWMTSYDLEAGSFNDHMVTLSRDLHRWRANFDFFQSTNGNWTFRFEVSLLDNQDLQLDYEQRSVQGERIR